MEIQGIFINEDVITYIFDILCGESSIMFSQVSKIVNNLILNNKVNTTKMKEYEKISKSIISLANRYSYNDDDKVSLFITNDRFFSLSQYEIISNRFNDVIYRKYKDIIPILIETHVNNIIKIIEFILKLIKSNNTIYDIKYTNYNESYLRFNIKNMKFE